MCIIYAEQFVLIFLNNEALIKFVIPWFSYSYEPEIAGKLKYMPKLLTKIAIIERVVLLKSSKTTFID